MIRTILAVMLGLLAALIAIVASQWIATLLFPPPAGHAIDHEGDLAALIRASSTGMFVSMLVGWTASSFAGGWVAARVCAPGLQASAAIAVGLLIMAGLAFMIWNLPYPTWVAVANLVLPVPVAWFASRMARRARVASS